MMEIWVAFITGLTTGGLSCMAVQGGLLASTLANQIEKDLQGRPASKDGKNGALRPQLALPIALFLVAKLLAYTLLGFLLGGLGSVLQLTPLMRAILQFAIGIFMIGNALRMLNVHPIFRYFAFEPPASLTRYIRRTAKGKASLFTPFFLGFLTILIPCGITQAMMAVAIGSANPLFGAAIMFAFVLGTSPVFFALAYLATRLGATLEKYFMTIVAVVVLILGLVAFDTGLNLLGSPYSLTRVVKAFATAETATSQVEAPVGLGLASGPAQPTQAPADPNTIVLNVLNNGYQPETLPAPAGVALKLNLVTNNTRSCSRAFVIPELNVEELLPATGTVTVDLPPQPAGKVLPFSCSMGMYTGQIVYQ